MATKVNERFYAYKNLVAISLMNLFTDTALLPVLNIQTSLFYKGGLGSMALFCLFFGTIFGSIFASAMSTVLGNVKTMALSISLSFSFLLANLYATWYTFIPTGLATGFGFGVLTPITTTYVKDLSRRYASFAKKAEDEVFSKFYPLYFSVFKLGQISGNSLVSAILKLPTKIPEQNETLCGPDFCPDINLPKETIAVSYKQLVTMVLSVCGIMSGALLIVVVFLDASKPSEVKPQKTKLELLILPLKELKDIRIMLLIPIILLGGIQVGFIYGDITEAFVTCYFGVDMVGWTMCVFGLSSFLFAVFYSYVCKYVGSFNILVCTTIVHLSFFACLLSWNKFNTHVFYPYLISVAVVGACDSAWRSMLPVFIRDVFEENLNEIFSLVYCLLHVGFCVSFIYAPYLCITTKIYINIGFIVLGMILAGVVHFRNLKWKNEWERIESEQETE